MEVITVSGPVPETDDPIKHAAWRQTEFNARGALVLRQSAQIQALQGQIASLEGTLTGLLDTCRGLVQPPEPDKELTDEERDKVDPQLPDPDAPPRVEPEDDESP